MSTLAASVLTLMDVAKRLDPDGKEARIVEMLSQTNEILDDMLWMEGNLPTGHRHTMRTGLPTVAWRQLNAGVQPSKSTTAQVDEACGMLEAFSEVDKDVAELNGNVNGTRLSEARAFVEAMSQEMAQTVFYGDTTVDPEEFLGLSPRFSASTAANGQNIVKGGGSGSDNLSIWLVGWGDKSVFGVYPKGSRAGLVHEDLGLQTVQTGTGIGTGRMRAYQDHWQWKCGLALKDWRYVVRICNVDVSALVAQSSDADLVLLMIKAINRMQSMSGVRPVFYMNRTAKQWLDIQRLVKVRAAGLTYMDVDGKRRPFFQDIPIKVCDALLNTEATVP